MPSSKVVRTDQFTRYGTAVRPTTHNEERETMTDVIPLIEQIKAIHPTSGKPITIVGVDATGVDLKLVVIHRGPKGIFAETIDYADEDFPRAAA